MFSLINLQYSLLWWVLLCALLLVLWYQPAHCISPGMWWGQITINYSANNNLWGGGYYWDILGESSGFVSQNLVTLLGQHPASKTCFSFHYWLVPCIEQDVFSPTVYSSKHIFLAVISLSGYIFILYRNLQIFLKLSKNVLPGLNSLYILWVQKD